MTMDFVTSDAYLSFTINELPKNLINRKFDLVRAKLKLNPMAWQQQMDKDAKDKIWVIAPDGTLVSGPGMPKKEEESKEGEQKTEPAEVKPEKKPAEENQEVRQVSS